MSSFVLSAMTRDRRDGGQDASVVPSRNGGAGGRWWGAIGWCGITVQRMIKVGPIRSCITCMPARSEALVEHVLVLTSSRHFQHTPQDTSSPPCSPRRCAMSFLRRRFGGGDTSSEPSREPTPDPSSEQPSNLRLVTAERLNTLKQKGKSKNGKRKNLWIFGLGGLFGLVIAAFFAGSNDLIDLKSIEGMNLESLMEALPANFVRSAQQLQVRMAHP